MLIKNVSYADLLNTLKTIDGYETGTEGLDEWVKKNSFDLKSAWNVSKDALFLIWVANTYGVALELMVEVTWSNVELTSPNLKMILDHASPDFCIPSEDKLSVDELIENYAIFDALRAKKYAAEKKHVAVRACSLSLFWILQRGDLTDTVKTKVLANVKNLLEFEEDN